MTDTSNRAQIDEAIGRFDRLRLAPAPGSEPAAREGILRDAFRGLAREVVLSTEPGRDRALALTHLEESFAWALRAVRP